MEYFDRSGYHFSKLALGTAQLGMNYGISNVNGKPPSLVAREVIDSALQAGITTLDTSASYGSSEQEIGEYLENPSARSKPIVVTKFKVRSQSSYKTQYIQDEVYKSIYSSLQRLRLKKIPVYLFHKDKEQHLGELIEPLLGVFEYLKNDGLVDIAGISAYDPEDVDSVLEYEILEAVQVPINIFDHRLIKTGRLEQLKEKNKIVFARSIFLQGLLFMKPQDLPAKLDEAKPYLAKLEKIAMAAGLTIPELSFAFAKNIDALTSIVFGALTPQQVHENVALLETPLLQTSIQDKIRDSFADVPELIITPGLW